MRAGFAWARSSAQTPPGRVRAGGHACARRCMSARVRVCARARARACARPARARARAQAPATRTTLEPGCTRLMRAASCSAYSKKTSEGDGSPGSVSMRMKPNPFLSARMAPLRRPSRSATSAGRAGGAPAGAGGAGGASGAGGTGGAGGAGGRLSGPAARSSAASGPGVPSPPRRRRCPGCRAHAPAPSPAPAVAHAFAPAHAPARRSRPAVAAPRARRICAQFVPSSWIAQKKQKSCSFVVQAC